MNATRVTALLGAAVVLAGPDVAYTQDSSSSATTRARMATARGMLERGEFRNAELIYASAIALLMRSDQALLASAHFGRAFAAHQRLVTGDTTGAPLSADAIVRDYALAESLDVTGLGLAAKNNTGLVLRAVGRHADAAAAFRAAAEREASASRRAVHLWNAGRELEAMGDRDAAGAAYYAAYAADPKNADIWAAMIDLLARHSSADSVIALARRWSADTTRAKAASDGLITLLLRDEPAVSEASAASALVTLAASWPTVRLGPAYFATMLADPLRRTAARHPSLSEGVAALADAYTPRESTRTYVEPPAAAWWRRESGRPDGRHAVWSRVLRSIGDAYNQQASGAAVARGYYEAALGWRRPSELMSPHIDRKAMLPLALIYLQNADAPSSTRLQNETREFTSALFDAKGAAYRAGDIAQIREYHTTLGAIYAAQGNWTGPGAQNAEFQLEGMRRATRELSARTSVELVDPPNLLEELAKHYRRTGNPAKASEVSRQIRASYTRIGRPAAGDSAVRRIDRTIPTVRRP